MPRPLGVDHSVNANATANRLVSATRATGSGPSAITRTRLHAIAIAGPLSTNGQNQLAANSGTTSPVANITRCSGVSGFGVVAWRTSAVVTSAMHASWANGASLAANSWTRKCSGAS